MNFTLLIAAALVASPSAPLEIKGIALGTPEAVAMDALNAPSCLPQSGGRTCFWSGVPMAGADAELLVTFDASGRATMARASFPSEHFARIRDALTVKYGKPARAATEHLQNALGAKFDNHWAEWRRGDQALILERYGDGLDSTLLLASEQADRDAAREREERARRDAADL